MTTVELIDDIEHLGSLRDRWDDLAVALGEPYRGPDWMLGWWKHASPPGSGLAVVAVTEGTTLLGLAPLYSEPRRSRIARYRFLAAPASLRTGPLIRPGRGTQVIREMCRVLAVVSPPADVLRLDGVSSLERWPEELTAEWPSPRAPALLHEIARPAPYVDLAARTYDGWKAAKSKNFREQLRRRRRKLEQQGASFRLTSTADELEPDIAAFIRLHHARWEHRGGSGVLTNRIERMLPHVARPLLEEGRFRLWTLEVEGRAISSHIFLAAGGEVSYWLGGFDREWASQQPSLQVLIAALEDAWSRGDRRFDLGGGGQAYKYRLADSTVDLQWSFLVPRGPRYAAARGELAPKLLRRQILGRIPDDAKDRVKRVLGRPTSGSTR